MIGDSRRLGLRLRLVRAVLWAERLAPGLTAAACLLAFGLALALFDVAALLPGGLHAVLLLGLAAGLGRVSWHLVRLRPPGADEVARRLEAESGVVHRPLAALADGLAQGDPTLWEAHRRRMAVQAEGLTPGWPRPVVAARDPFALRFAALLLLVLALAGGWRDAGDRIGRFLTPALGLTGWGPSFLAVWVTPPAATGLPPFTVGGEGPLSIPEGSAVGVALSGGWGPAAVLAGKTRRPLDADGKGGQRGEAVMEAGDVLAVEQLWRRVAQWPVNLVPDRPPEVRLSQLPEADERARLRLGIEASDDYGLARLWIELRPLEAGITVPPERVDLSLPAERPRSVSLAPRLDLASHDWAGREVVLTPVAEDTKGQVARGDHVALVLPERHFRHPLAQALIQWRAEAGDAPRKGPEIAEDLGDVLDRAERLNLGAREVLGLALARSILSSPRGFDRAEMRDLLWSVATRIEDGGATAAEQAMAEARRDLERALAEGAPPEVLSQLLDRFEAALGRWLETMAGHGPHAPSPEAGGPVLTDEDLAAGLDELRALAESGDREALRRRLAEMADMLSRLEGGEDGGALPPEAAAALAALGKLAARQQDLLEQSFRNAPPPSSPEAEEEEGESAPSGGRTAKGEVRTAAQAQSALEKALAEMAGGLPQASGELARARRAMSEAAQSLERGDWAAAAEAQTESLAALRGAGRQMAQAARGGREGGRVMRDPFGRAVTGQDGGVTVPAQGETQRARDILNELRRRAGDAGRPAPERDYLRRLLKQF